MSWRHLCKNIKRDENRIRSTPILITYMRSSSYGRYDFCPMAYFMEYNLGWTSPPNIRADMGTITHQVLEIMALAKKALQDGKKKLKYKLHNTIININAENYNIKGLIKKVYEDYTQYRTCHEWTSYQYEVIQKWVWQALEYNNGQVDPRNRHIIDAEPHFDFPIEKDWAKYNYTLGGQEAKGCLRLKGTIDLITQLDEKTYEIIDWKTGLRINWGTGERKTYEKLKNDFQLRLYHLAGHYLYNVDQIIVTIMYIRDGGEEQPSRGDDIGIPGAFSLCFSEKDLTETKSMIKMRYGEIFSNRSPAQRKTWRCKSFCNAGKTDFSETSMSPITSPKDTKTGSQAGCFKSKCDQIYDEVRLKGMKWVLENCTNPDFCVNTYSQG